MSEISVVVEAQIWDFRDPNSYQILFCNQSLAAVLNDYCKVAATGFEVIME